MKTAEKNIRYPIRNKIFLVSLIPTLALLAAALINHQYLSNLGDSAERILSKNYRSIRAAQDARKGLEEMRNHVLELPHRPESVLISPEALRRLSGNLDTCRENITEAGERELIDRLTEDYRQYERKVRSFGDAKAETRATDRYAVLTLTAEMVALIDELVSINEEAMEAAERQTRLLAQKAQRHAAIFFGIIITVILALSYFLSYRIARPIMSLAHHLSNTQEGRGVYPIIRARSEDEIGFLTRSFNRLFYRLEQYDRYRDDILAAEKEKVRRSEEARGRFIADISHQLKTPMTSLSMSVGMLQKRGRELGREKSDKLVATAHEDCNRLSALINELVDISRLEAVSQPRPKETLDIAVVIQECISPLLKQAAAKAVSIEIDIPENLPRVTIDSFRFPWVVTNLVGNALRYTEQGGRIQLKVYRQGRRFYFQCTDTGSGIDPQYLPRIFDRFSQFSERGRSGTIGLGLAIVKDIIEQHGGDVAVESRLGEGTTFTFWIPSAKEKSE